MTNPVYTCPHCKGAVEVELDEKGQIILHSSTLKETPE